MTIPGSELEETKSTESNHEPAPFNHNILHVIYSVCITGLVVVIAICYICIHRLKNKKTEQTRAQENSSQENEIQNALTISLPFHESTVRLESIYDEIDEVSLHNAEELHSTHRNVVSESSSDKTFESEKENMQNDDYLNPYQPTIEDSDKHDYKTVMISTNNLDRIEDNRIVHKGNEEIQLENVSEHQYLDVIFDPRYEYPINICIMSSTTYGSSSQLNKKVQYADTVNKQTNENLQTSERNLRLSNKDKPKEFKEKSKLSSPVPNKRLTI
ncbi:unnamed protein product [Mytilus coruscus]|uniref:Uncharacterized protein n=1 Tax=Mytilus coruscus TaxID=42192 RepID=A0A6J8EVT0_MYTCO|nr:unnamed protein product [Mytilus coruscus]